jgi:hypothetical protein
VSLPIAFGLAAALAAAPPSPTPDRSPIAFARTLPGDSTRIDVAAGILPFGDGALITGWTSIAGAPAQGLLMWIDREASLRWRLELGGEGADLLFGAQPDSAGGFVCAGFTTSRRAHGDSTMSAPPDTGGSRSDGWMVRVDTAGVVTWERTLGGAEDERLTAIQPTREGWMVAGQTSRGGNVDAWVVRLDREGREIGAWTWGAEWVERALGLLALPDGGCVVVGRVGDGREAVDAFVTRLDAQGRQVWTRTIAGPGFQVAYHVRPHPDSSFVVTGYGYVSPARDHDGLVLRIGADGRAMGRYDLGDARYDRATQSVVLDDGAIVTVGYSRRLRADDSDPVWQTVIYALDPRGRKIWTAYPPGEGVESGRWIAASRTDVWAVGQVTPPGGGSRVLVMRLEPSGARSSAESGR